MYKVNEIFYSLQGEGIRAGTPNIFIRFSGCNLQCRKEIEGFDCDTEFTSGTVMNIDTLVQAISEYPCQSVIFTGGEPALQLDSTLVKVLRDLGYYLAIETNGTKILPDGIDWVCCSPKSAEHTLRVGKVSEVKYVRHSSQGIPKPSLVADYYLISPAWDAEGLSEENLRHCVQLVKDNPMWRLSIQQHKVWGVQ